jgi:hypothetical protein
MRTGHSRPTSETAWLDQERPRSSTSFSAPVCAAVQKLSAQAPGSYASTAQAQTIPSSVQTAACPLRTDTTSCSGSSTVIATPHKQRCPSSPTSSVIPSAHRTCLVRAFAAAGCGASGVAPRTTAPRTETSAPGERLPRDVVPPRAGVRHVGGGELGTQTSLGGVPVPFSHYYFHVTNLWGARRRGIYIEVYAGAPAAKPHRGGLIVNWTNPKVGVPTPHSGLYLAPASVGPLTLVDVRGNRIYFVFVGGRGTFSLKSRTFSIDG